MTITQGFGANEVDFYKKLGMKGHNALDLRAAKGTPCFACFEGTVVVAAKDSTGGNEVRLRSQVKVIQDKEYRLEAVYYHLDSFKCKVGDTVKPWQVIALTGNTGKYTTAPHLHFGLKPEWFDTEWKKDRDNGYFGCIDPLPFINVDELPVDRRYGLKRDIKKEILFRFKSPLIRLKLGHAPTNRELKALVYGNWPVETLLAPAMFATWSIKTK